MWPTNNITPTTINPIASHLKYGLLTFLIWVIQNMPPAMNKKLSRNDPIILNINCALGFDENNFRYNHVLSDFLLVFDCY